MSSISSKLSIKSINCLSRSEFEIVFSNVVESWPKAAKTISNQLPFDNINVILTEFDNYLENLTKDDQKTILKLHPDLAGKLADEGKLTRESEMEQTTAGLNQLNEEQKNLLTNLNEKYLNKFGFPFVICVRETNRIEAIINGLNTRLNNTVDQELQIGISEVKKICRLRVCQIIE